MKTILISCWCLLFFSSKAQFRNNIRINDIFIVEISKLLNDSIKIVEKSNYLISRKLLNRTLNSEIITNADSIFNTEFDISNNLLIVCSIHFINKKKSINAERNFHKRNLLLCENPLIYTVYRKDKNLYLFITQFPSKTFYDKTVNNFIKIIKSK